MLVCFNTNSTKQRRPPNKTEQFRMRSSIDPRIVTNKDRVIFNLMHEEAQNITIIYGSVALIVQKALWPIYVQTPL